jgi:tellurite resistance protein TerC
MFLVLVMIELSDVVFAIDSIPAIFAVTQDPFIVITSNLFAIMGLRAMYFLLADIAERMYLLQYGLAIVLGFIGLKMLLMDVGHVPISWSLLFVLSVISLSVIGSMLFPKKSEAS